jgi:hypothetical protein
MRYAERADGLVYKGQTKATRTLSWWCSACGEAIFTGEPLVAHKQTFKSSRPRSTACSIRPR